MRLIRYLVVVFLFCPLFAYGQGSRKDDVATKNLVTGLAAAPGALITVCTSAGVGVPCTPLASIYSDVGLTSLATNGSAANAVSCSIGPTTNPCLADSNGNYGFYASPGRYVVTVTGAGTTGKSVVYTLACDPSAACTVSGTTTLAATNASIVNKEIYVGPGLTYTTIAAAMASADCPAAGCTIHVRPDATLDTTTVSLNKAGVHIVFDAGSYTYTGTGGLFNCNSQVAGVRISGANRGATVGATQGTVINISNTAASLVAGANTQGCPGLLLDHFSGIGPGSGTGVGLQLTGTRMELDSILIASFGGNGATVDGSVNNSNLGTCYHSRFQGNGGVGMLLTGVNSDGWVMNGCDWAGNTGDGFVCDGTSKFTTFQGTNGDSNVSGIGYHFKNCSQSTGFLFVDSATNNVTLDAASGQNWLYLVGGGPVSDSGSGNRLLGNTNLPSYAWNFLDVFNLNIFGLTSGRGTLTVPAIVGTPTWTLPATTGNVPSLPTITTTETGSGAVVKATSPTVSNMQVGLGALSAIKDSTGATSMGLTLKKGSGAGNYTSASTTYVVVDSTNLCNTVTVPTGWKLSIVVNGALGTATGAVVANLALTDNAACSTANAGILVETTETTTAAGVLQPIGLGWVIAGDGAAHNIALQFKTSNGADSATLLNSSATSLPTMVFTLMPSN